MEIKVIIFRGYSDNIGGRVKFVKNIIIDVIKEMKER